MRDVEDWVTGTGRTVARQPSSLCLLCLARRMSSCPVLERPPAPMVDLLLTDVVMAGGMNGLDLMREARARRPGLWALLTSDRVAGSPAEAAAGLPMLPIPHQPADLARAVRGVFADC